MKKILLIAVAFVGGTMMMNAQDIAENALGLRLGDSDGFGAEISYQRALGSENRLELDLGIRNGNDYDGFKLAGIYQWVWNIDGGFNWYAGPGAGIASYSYDYKNDERNDDSETFVFIGGDIGIEYNFDIPLLLSLDFRPEFGLGNDTFDNNDLGFDIALGIRYQF
jgi:opacity protein-like surface antigen